MNTATKKFIRSQATELYKRARALQETETRIVTEASCLSYDFRALESNLEEFTEMVKELPELMQDDAFKNTYNALVTMKSGMKRRRVTSPIEALLNWEAEGGDLPDGPFISNQMYDLLGKDNARTFRALLRDVVLMADPTFTGEV